MKKIVLFSTITETNSSDLLENIFPIEITNKVIAYMPSDGANMKDKYINEWKDYSQKHNTNFILINNSINSKEEIQKLLKANILVISGGNTFVLLDNLRKSGLNKAIKEFVKKDNFVLAGMSAGALVLTPSIKISELIGSSENSRGIKDLTGLNIVDIEIFPHFDREKHDDLLKKYKTISKSEVKTISNDDYVLINLDV